MGNRNDDQKTAYFELGNEEITLSVDATSQEVDKVVERIKEYVETSNCVGTKLNKALETLFSKYSDLKEVVTANACALNAATC